MVRGDLNDVAGGRAAAAGCYGAVDVTNFWEHFEGRTSRGSTWWTR